MSDNTEPTPATDATPAAPAAAPTPTAAPEAPATATAAGPAKAKVDVKATLDHRIAEAKATAKKAWTGALHLSERARAEASKVTTRGRERWSVLAPRAKELSDRTRTRVTAVWKDQVAGARAGLARLRAVFGKRAG